MFYKTLLWIVVIFFGAHYSFCSAEVMDNYTRRLLKRASGYIAEKDYGGAAGILAAYVDKQSRPAPAMVYNYLGNAHYLNKNLSGAFDAFYTGAKYYDSDMALIRNAASTAVALKQYLKAADLYEMLYQADPENDPEHLFGAARAAAMGSDFLRALKITDILVAGDIRSCEWWSFRVDMARQLNLPDVARSAAKAWSDEYPGDPAAWRILSILYAASGEDDHAAMALAHVAAMDEATSSEWTQLAVWYSETGAVRMAMNAIEQACPDPCTKYLPWKAELYARAGRFKQAAEILSAMPELNKKQMARVGYYLYQAQLYDTAFIYLAKAVDAGETSSWTVYTAGLSAWQCGRPEKAMHYFSRAAKAPDTSEAAKAALKSISDSQVDHREE